MKNKKIIIGIVAVILAITIFTGIVIAVTKSNSTKIGTVSDEEETKAEAKEIVLENNNYMHVETDASGDKVPVPNGFVGSSATGENEIDTGFVIYEGEEEVTDSNVTDAQKTRNQYVWIPVPDPSTFYGTDANGKKWGKLYFFSTSTSNETGTTANNWSESNGIMSISSTTGYREPDVVRGSSSIGYDMDSRLRTLGLGAETTHEFLMQLEKEFNKMIESVEKYGGFYIGRYETGDLNQDVAVVQKGNTNISNQTWYTMYKKCKTLSNNNNNVVTGMAWGNQFDRTLMWLIESGAKTKEEISRNSTSWANFKNATFEYTNSSGSVVTKNSVIYEVIPAGSTDYTKANNIYDLAGNVEDWTMEARSSGYRVLRGGNCSDYGPYVPAEYRSGNGPTGSSGCRSALYIK